MLKKIEYLKKITVHSDTLILNDVNLNSSAKFVYFMQNYLEELEPYIKEWAEMEYLKFGDNMLVLCTPFDVTNYDEYLLIKYQNNSLTVSSKLKLVENYSKFKDYKKIMVWVSLCK